MVETQRWQAIPTQLALAEFEQFVLPHLSLGSRGPAPKLRLYKIFNVSLRHEPQGVYERLFRRSRIVGSCLCISMRSLRVSIPKFVNASTPSSLSP